MTSMTMSNMVNNPNDGQSMTVFFRPKAIPVRYVKVQRPEIIQTHEFEAFKTKYPKYYVDKSLWIEEVI